MQFNLTQHLPHPHDECLVLGIFSDGNLPEIVASLPESMRAVIPELIARLLKNKTHCWHIAAQQSLLLIYCQTADAFNATSLPKLLLSITEQVNQQALSSVTLALPQVLDRTADQQIELMVTHIQHAHDQFLTYKSKDIHHNSLTSVTFYLQEAHTEAIKQGQAVAAGMHLCRTLANAPANHCTPTFLATQALALAQEFKSIQTKIHDQAAVEKLGMGALLAVAKGSHEPLKFIEMHYQGTPTSQPPIVLIGKGVTFDAGGISLKPGAGMNEMKYDMAGAASVLGTLKTCAMLALPLHVIGLLPCTENMPGGNAVKPGDIVTSLSGQTIEIVNTDAEGRLLLADALTYAEQFKPKFVLDVATLTGAIIIALGHVASGYMTTHEALASRIEAAAKDSLDRVWRMPLDDQYQDALASPLADMVNATFDRIAGSVTAACFLSRYASQFPWAHIDIAGTAWNSGKNNDATGRPVPLLTQLLRHIADES